MKRGFGLGLSLAAALILLLAINVIASMSLRGAKADLTEDKLYTLSDGTKQLLGRIDDKIDVKLFYSKRAANNIPRLKQYADRVIELLRQYEGASGGKLALEIFEPRPDTETEEQALNFGLRPMNPMGGEDIYLGLVMTNEVGQEESIPLLSPNREDYLEYDISRLVGSIDTVKRKKIGVLSSLDVMGNADDPLARYSGARTTPSWVFVSEFKQQYDVEKVAVDAGAIDKSIDMLLVIHPKELSETTQFAIDQYILGGGRAIVMVDPYCFDEQAKFQSSDPNAAYQAKFNSGLPKLFEAWGIEMPENKVVADPDLATQLNTGRGFVNHPAFVSLGVEQCNGEDIISADIENMMMAFPGCLRVDDSEKQEGLNYEWLLRTSDKAGETDAMMLRFNSDPSAITRELKSEGEPLDLALKITGRFKTAFPHGRPVAEGDDEDADVAGPEQVLTECAGDNTVVVFADVDMIADQFSVSRQNFFGQTIVQLLNDNLAMFSNATEQLMGAPELVALRTRGKSDRPFTLVDKIEREAKEKWRDSEEELRKEQEETMQRLQQLEQGKSEGAATVLSESQRREIQTFRKKLAENKKDLREVRRNLREDIEALGTKLKFINIALMPLLVLFAGFIPVFWRHRKMKR